MPPFSATGAVKDALALAFRRLPLLLLVSALGTLAAATVLLTSIGPSIVAWAEQVQAQALTGAVPMLPSLDGPIFVPLICALLGFVFATTSQIAALGLDVRGESNGPVAALWTGLKGLPAFLLGYFLIGLLATALFLGAMGLTAVLGPWGMVAFLVAFLALALFHIATLPWPFLAVVEGRGLSAFSTARALTKGRMGAIGGGLFLLSLALFGIGLLAGFLGALLTALVAVLTSDNSMIAPIVGGLIQFLMGAYTGASVLAYGAVVYEERLFLPDVPRM